MEKVLLCDQSTDYMPGMPGMATPGTGKISHAHTQSAPAAVS